MGARTPIGASGLILPQFPGPLDQYREAVQLKSLLQGQRINQAQLEQFEQQQEDRQRMRQEQERTQSLLREVGGDFEEFFKKAPGRGISMGSLLKMKESYRKDQQEYRAQSVEERAARKERMALFGSEAAAVLAGPQDQRKRDFIQRVQGLVSRRSLTPQQAQQFSQLAQLPDEEFNRQLEMIQLSAVGATKLFEAEEKREAEKAKRTTRQKEFQSFLPTYLKSKGLPKNAKTEMQAFTSPEWKAWQGRTDRTEKPPSASGKALAERTKQRAMERAEKEYEKKIATLEKDWQQDPYQEGNWFNYKTAESISNEDYLALRKGAEDDLISAKEQADESYLAQLEALGFEPGQPVDYRGQVRARDGKPTAAQQEPTAVNPQTGERLVYRGGKWVPVPK